MLGFQTGGLNDELIIKKLSSEEDRVATCETVRVHVRVHTRIHVWPPLHCSIGLLSQGPS